MVVIGSAVVHKRVAILELHALKRGALRKQAAGDFRRYKGKRGRVGAPDDQRILRCEIPRGEPLLPVGADGDILCRHPAGAADGAHQIERAVRALGIDHQRLIDANARQVLIIKLRIRRIVEDLLVRGEGV